MSRTRYVALLVGVVAFAAFAPSLGGDFVGWDDDSNFLNNPAYRGLGWEQLRWMWTTFHMGHWIPLSWMTLGADYTLWGMHPAGYHLTNVLLHSLCAVLVFDVARTLTLTADVRADARADIMADDGATFIAAAAALLWAVHPLRVESVAWITERRDMLSLLFMLLSIRFYVASAREPGPSRRHYLVALAAFAAALMSKATAVTLPVVLLILDVYPLKRWAVGGERWAGARRVVTGLVPFFALSAAFSILSIVALDPGKQLGVAGKLAVSCWSLAFYLWKTVVPANLAPLYAMPRQLDPLEPRFIVGYLVTAAVLGVALWSRRIRPAVTAAIAVFLVIVFPLLGVVQNGPQIAADRYTYHASPALMLLAGAGLAALPLAARARVGLLALATVALCALSWAQQRHWQESERLWRRVLTVGESSLARTALANVLLSQNRLDEAISQFRASLAIDSMSVEADNNLGIALARQGKLDEAIIHYRRQLEIEPRHYEAHNNWGVALGQLGRLPEAIDHYARALAIQPDYADADVNWGNALVRLGRPAEALPHYEKASRNRPGFVDAYLNWGVALAQLSRFPEAIEKFNAVLRLDPANLQAVEYLKAASAMNRPR